MDLPVSVAHPRLQDMSEQALGTICGLVGVGLRRRTYLERPLE